MVFAFYMTSLGSGIPSELTFGYIDKTKFTIYLSISLVDVGKC